MISYVTNIVKSNVTLSILQNSVKLKWMPILWDAGESDGVGLFVKGSHIMVKMLSIEQAN